MTSNFPTANNNTRNTNPQASHAQNAGVAPSDSYNVSVEAEADAARSTYGSTHTTRPPTYGNTAPSATTTFGDSFPANSNTLTGNEYLRLLKEDRKRSTVSSGFLGGTVGLLFLGPVGPVIGGTTSAVITKRSRKRQERHLREQLRQQGALDKPFVARVGRYY